MTFRFLHTADLHLDSPLLSLALRDPGLAAEVATASRLALTRIVDLCLSEEVHALLIAGDLWDGGQTSAKTPRFLKQELMRLSEAGIRCFIIRGNHDAMSKVTRELEPPPLTHVFGTRPGTQSFEAGGHLVAVHGISFPEGAVAESLLPRYPAPTAGAFNIGMMHTSLNGSAGHDTYAPCALTDLQAHGYDYWALGHIHLRAEYPGVVMPGIPQGRHIGEAGPCTVTLGSWDGRLSLRQVSVAALRFERLAVEVGGIADWSALVARLALALREAAALPRPEAHLVLRPQLQGATPLAWRIARDLDQLAQEAQAQAETLPGLWIDKLETATRPLGPPAQALPPDLVALVTETLPQDPALLAQLTETARDLVADLPSDLRGLLGDDEALLAASVQGLLAEGLQRLLPRLSPEVP